MDKLVREQLRIGILDANDLGAYYQAFFMITQFLMRKNRIFAAEQSRAFVRGFQPDLWNHILCRLKLKFLNHYPDDPYPLVDIHEAAQYVLHGTTHAHIHHHNTTMSPTTSTVTSNTGLKSEDLTAFLDKFAQTLIKVLVPQMQSAHVHQQPQTHSYNNLNLNFANDPRCCMFCGHTDHLIKNCLVCQQYLADKKCVQNAEGKIVLPSGSFVPRHIPGRFLKERIDE